MTRGSHSSVSHRKSSCERRPLSQEGFPIVSPGQGELRQASRAAAQGARNPRAGVAGAVVPCGKSPHAGGRRRSCGSQETLRWTTGDAVAGGKSCCAGRQEPMRRAARPIRRADRQETLLRAAGAAALGSRRVGNPRARHAQEKAVRAADAATPCGRSPHAWRQGGNCGVSGGRWRSGRRHHCSGRQKLLRLVRTLLGAVALGGRSRCKNSCAGWQEIVQHELLRKAARAVALVPQEPLLRAQEPPH